MTETITPGLRAGIYPITGMVTIPTDFQPEAGGRLPAYLRTGLVGLTDDQRTFFAGHTTEYGFYLIVHRDDERSMGFHAIADDANHLVWSITGAAGLEITLFPEPGEKSEIEKFVTGMATVTNALWSRRGPYGSTFTPVTDDGRTFFYANDPDENHPGHVLLVCHETDPRASEMWNNDSIAIPEGHKVWRISTNSDGLTLLPFEAPAVPEDVEDPFDDVEDEGDAEETAEPVTPEWVIGQEVSGSDYALLPVGAQVASQFGGATFTKEAPNSWERPGVLRRYEDANLANGVRRLTALPDGIEILAVGDHVIIEEAEYAESYIGQPAVIQSLNNDRMWEGKRHSIEVRTVNTGMRVWCVRVSKVAEPKNEEHGTETVEIVATATPAAPLPINAENPAVMGEKLKVIDPQGSVFAHQDEIVTVVESADPGRTVLVENAQGQQYGMYAHRFERVVEETVVAIDPANSESLVIGSNARIEPVNVVAIDPVSGDQAAMAIDPTGGPGVETRPFTPEETEALDAPEIASREDLSRLLEQAQKDLAEAKEHHVSDVETISKRLIDEAERRSWCEEYDEIMVSLNRTLHVPISKRFTNYTVDVTAVVPMRWRGRAVSEDSAREQAREWVNRNTVRNASASYRDVAIRGVEEDN